MPEMEQGSTSWTLAEAVMDACPLGVAGFDRHGVARAFNQAAEMLTGFRKDEIVGRIKLPNLLGSPDQAVAAFKMMEGPGFGGPGRLTEFDATLASNGGAPIPVIFSLCEVKEAGLSFKWLAHFQATHPGGSDAGNRTRLSRKSLALRECEERYQALLDSSPDAIALYDAVGRVTYLNPAFVQVFGWSVGEVKGQRLDFVPEESREETVDAVGRMVAGETIRNWRTRRLAKDGRTLDVQISASMIRGQDGTILGTLVILRDISEQVRLEEEKAQQERLQGVLEMAVTAAHEMSQPLQVIVGNSSFLLKELVEGEEVKDAVSDIMFAARNLGDIVYKIQRISRYKTVIYVGESQMIDLAKASTPED